ncbi:MAG: PA2169 family four-helix-bundle protein [Janthinobacterium lividum]
MTTNVVSVLNKLIKTSKDGEQGFRNAAENVSNESLKQMFLEKAQGCKAAAQELQLHVTHEGEEPEESGSIMGAIHRGWMNVKSTIAGQDDHAILAECERGEDVAKATYANALKEDLPSDIRAVVQHQYQGVLSNHDQIRDLRDSYVNKS